MTFGKHSIALAVIIALPLFIGCSGLREVSSSFADSQIIIDGNPGDWNNLTYVDGENISFGFRNDESSLYLCMATNDRNKIIKILRGGLTVWVEPENPGDKIGINYPGKIDLTGLIQMRRNNSEMPESQQEDDDARMNKLLSAQSDLFLMNENNLIINTIPINSDYYAAKIIMADGLVFYELKIPFDRNSLIDYSLKSRPGKTLSITFETGEMERMGMRQKTSVSLGEGDNEQSPRNMRDRSGMSGERGSGMNMDTSPLKYKFIVKLVTP